MSFPRDRGELSPQIYATLLLIAAVRLHGGELRIPALLLESVQGGESILHDFDHSTQELVLRCGSASANLLALPAEDKWQAMKPATSKGLPPTNSTSFSETQKSRSTADDSRVAEIEQQQNRERMLSDLRQRRNEALNDLHSTSTRQGPFSANLEDALRKAGNETG